MHNEDTIRSVTLLSKILLCSKHSGFPFVLCSVCDLCRRKLSDWPWDSSCSILCFMKKKALFFLPEGLFFKELHIPADIQRVFKEVTSKVSGSLTGWRNTLLRSSIKRLMLFWYGKISVVSYYQFPWWRSLSCAILEIEGEGCFP